MWIISDGPIDMSLAVSHYINPQIHTTLTSTFVITLPTGYYILSDFPQPRMPKVHHSKPLYRSYIYKSKKKCYMYLSKYNLRESLTIIWISSRILRRFKNQISTNYRVKKKKKLTKAQFGIGITLPLPPPTANVKTKTMT